MNYFIQFKNTLRELRKECEIEINNQNSHLEELTGKFKTRKYGWYLKTKGLLFGPYFKPLEKEYNKVMSSLETLEKMIGIIKSLIRVYDNEKAIGSINNPAMLLYIVKIARENNLIDIQTASHILGSSFVFDISHRKNNAVEDTNYKFMYLVTEYISKFYNPDGSFKNGGHPKSLEAYYNQLGLIAAELGISLEQNRLKRYSEFASEVSDLYSNELKNIIIPIPEEAEKTKKHYNPRFKELKKYYKNGKIVCIPEDMEAFAQLLDECALDDSEKRYIYKLIEMEIQKSLINVDAAPKNCDEVDKEINNLIFLLNPSGNKYFYEDIDKIDSGIQKRVYSLLNKIKPHNKSQFRRVFSEADISFEIYEVINGNVHVIFVEIDAGIYLILGTAPTGKNYKEIARRFFARKNQAYINEIKVAIKTPGEREKLLRDNDLRLFNESRLTRGKKN